MPTEPIREKKARAIERQPKGQMLRPPVDRMMRDGQIKSRRTCVPYEAERWPAPGTCGAATEYTQRAD